MLELKVKTDDAKIVLQNKTEQARDLRPFFTNFYTYMQSRTQLTFKNLRKGGSFRGVHWPWFAKQYTRKTDGATIPAEGGISRLYSTGTVKARLRGRGKSEKDRVKPTSNLLRHRGVLYKAALNTVQKRAARMTMDTSVNYAGRQNALRPFQFFELPKDGQVAARMAGRYLDE